MRFSFAAFLLAFIMRVHAEVGLSGDYVRLRPSSPAIMCNTGDIRVDSTDSNKLKICRLFTWYTVLDSQHTSPIIFDPGGDASIDMLQVDVTDAPTLSWDEPNDQFAFSKGLNVSGDSTSVGDWSQVGDILVNGNVTATQMIATRFVGNLLGNSTGTHTGPSIGSLTGTASFATALAANPADCASDQYAIGIDTGANLTCAQVSFTQISGAIGLAQGGTNNTALSVTAGTVYYGDGTKLIGLAPGTAGQTLVSSASTIAWRSFNFVANNSTGAYTPSAQNVYVNPGQGNSLALTAGTWVLYASHNFGAAAGVGYGQMRCGWYGAQGTGNSTAPAALSSLSGLTVLAGSIGDNILPAANSDNAVHTLVPLLIRLSQSQTPYLVCISPMTTAANARWFDNIWAEQVQ